MATVTIDDGTDVSCVNDISSDGRTVNGRRALAEAVSRRLITPRGRLIDDPNYGFDLTQYINDDITAADLAAMQSGIQTECLKDERVLRVSATATLPSNGIMTTTIVLTDAIGPFSLVLGITAVSLNIISVT